MQKKITGIALAVGAAAIFSMAPLHAASNTADTATIKCKGANACKGQSACKTATNACKGQNSCKGTGMLMTNKADCEKAGGTVMDESMKTQ